MEGYLDLKERTSVINLMKNKLLLQILSVIIFSLLSCNSDKKKSRVEVLPYYNESSFTPLWQNNTTNPDLQKLHQIPSFSLINQNNEIITEKTFENKIYVADFFFTSCPGICPKMTSNMKVLQKAFQDDDQILLVSHSVTPTYDTPQILKKYALNNDIMDSKWHLLTGTRDEIYELGRNQYFVEEDLGLEKTSDEFLHTENFILVDMNRHIRGIYNGLNTNSINQLIADIKTLQKERN